MENIMFNLKENQILLSPHFEKHTKQILDGLSKHLTTKHFIILSSGTTGGKIKGFAISEKALFANAKAVNNFFDLSSKDIWALSLPSFHVGGLSVLARAYLLNNKVITFEKWNAKDWITKIALEKVTISTIVPTQLYDLLQSKKSPPKDLKYLIVGGDFLSDQLESMALERGWPVYRTFGMTEVSSQLASSKTLRSKMLEILPLHQVKIENEHLLVKSDSLFTLQFTIDDEIHIKHAKEFCDSEDYFITQDLVELRQNALKPLGRLDDKFKISGRLFDLLDIKNSLEKIALERNEFKKVEVAVHHDERKGQVLNLLVHRDVKDVSPYLEDLSPLVPHEVVYLDSFQRTELGKLKKKLF